MAPVSDAGVVKPCVHAARGCAGVFMSRDLVGVGWVSLLCLGIVYLDGAMARILCVVGTLQFATVVASTALVLCHEQGESEGRN